MQGTGRPIKKPATFTFLGFIHFRARTRKGGVHVGRTPGIKTRERFVAKTAEWISIRLSIGTWLPLYPAATVRDRRDADLPAAGRRAFRLDNTAWEYPSFDNAEVLVARLVRAGLLVRDPAVAAALAGDWQAMTRRSAQRHFRLATGLTHRTYRQVERARYAAGLLRDGAGIGETVHLAGYYDQAHLTRSLTRLIGQSPARIRRHETQLSLLYKTSPQG